MDSLVTSTIGLAAGGWDKVKLVGIYSTDTTGIPSWKLGICNITEMSSGGTAITQTGLACTIAPFSAVLVAPETHVTYVTGCTSSSNYGTVSILTKAVQFTANSIRGSAFVAVLFTW